MKAHVLRYSAFTHDGRGGNPAGVVLDAQSLTEAQMQAIARDVGYSETAFLLPDAERPHARLRFFSPLAEVAFCGHATLATAVAFAERHGTGDLRFCTDAGSVVVHTWADGQRFGATLTSPAASSRPATAEEVAETLAAFGWTENDIDPRFPVHVAFAGNHHLILPVASRRTLASMDYSFQVLAELMAARRWTTVNVFWAETREVFHSRNPFPPGGVVEDPATGAAAAAFGGYLREIRSQKSSADFTIYQGQDLGSPSLLHIGLRHGEDGVLVSGHASALHPSSGVRP